MQIRPIVESPLQRATLETLLEGYQQAHAEATTELIRRLSRDLLRFFLAQETTRTEAEDLLQNTLPSRITPSRTQPATSWGIKTG